MTAPPEDVVADPPQTVAELKLNLIERTAQLEEALTQQAASAEILQIINSSSGELAPVFDVILDKAHTLCGATRGALFLFDGVTFRAAAVRGYPDEIGQRLRQGVTPSDGPAFKPLIEGARLFHQPDLLKTIREDDRVGREVIERGGVRTNLMLPLRKDNVLLGVISCNRHEVRPFADKEIALLENFAAQAVIAIENARLLSELRTRTADLQESLEYQTATSDVLKVLSRSAFELETVLQTVATAALRLCRADSAVVYRNEGGVYRWAAGHLLVPEYEERERMVAIRPGTGTVVGRAALEARTVHILDAWTDPLYEAKDDAQVGGVHTMLGVPLLREGVPIGAFGLGRRRVEAFSEREIALVTTFADQAVIAIENARLLTELRARTDDLQESLEYQTATSDVLKVISRSTFDLQPVLDTLLSSAARLCNTTYGSIAIRQGTVFRRVATLGYSQELDNVLRAMETMPGPDTIVGRTLLERRIIHVTDLAVDPDYRLREVVELDNMRTGIGVPLLREGDAIGVIILTRNHVEPFTERQIELIRTFADQAVIAIENARLLTELDTRQAELRVTFDNMGDAVIMFDAAQRLVAWNRNFQQMLDIPEEWLAVPRTYTDFLNYLTTRGEFAVSAPPDVGLGEGEVRPISYERTRPNGRVLEVRRNPVPGGGFVFIYSDITERKLAEQSIHAARDAAERALADLKLAQANLIQSEKLASLGALTAGIAHEIKNPLNFVNNFANLSNELLGELKETAAPAFATLDADKRDEIDETIDMLTGNLERIQEHGRRADGIVKSMLAHSRGSSGDRREVDVNALVEESLNLAYHGARAQDQNFNITLERDYDKALKPIELVPQDITRVFLNLCSNGFYAANKRKRDNSTAEFSPALKVATRELGDAVEVRVRDNGTGIPSEIKDKLFQPFFTTKPTGEGTGLGLSISYDIVTQQHGGTIAVDSRVGDFTEFTIRLPRKR